MHQVEEVPSLPINLNGTLLKTEIIEQPTLAPTPISVVESSVAPPTHPVPIAPAQPVSTSTPIVPTKKVKRGLKSIFGNKKTNRLLTKPATLLARPAPIATATILPNSQKPVILANSIAPIIPKTVPTNPVPGFTTYLVFDGGQGQLVQVANDGPKPVTFRNQSGQLLQATPITVVSTPNQPVVSSFPINGDCSLLSNSSQTITTVRTSSSIDLQQQTTLTSDTTTLTTQQLTGIIHQPTILNGHNLSTYDSNSSLDESKLNNNNLSLSLSQIAQKVSHRHRRSSSSSTSKKKRGRPRLYERDPFTNKPIKTDGSPTSPPISSSATELIIPTITNTALIMPSQTPTFNPLSLSSQPNTCNSLIFANQAAPSLLQQHQYTYPSLLNGTASTNILTPPTFPSIAKDHSSLTPVQTPSNLTSLNISPIKSSTNDDVKVHFIGGYVIRESSQPFLKNETNQQKENHEQIRCVICQKLDSSQRFFNREKKFCSSLCSIKSHENIPPPSSPPQLMQTEIEEPVSLPPDHGLPHDPSKWTVYQVGEFIGRLTNDTIRQAFHESEMDGQALLLMTPEHLRETLKIKLGPSLVIASEIDKLRERVKASS